CDRSGDGLVRGLPAHDRRNRRMGRPGQRRQACGPEASARASCRTRPTRRRRGAALRRRGDGAMTPIDFWFDPVSPYAYLAFERLPEAFVGLSYTVAYRPIVFGALLKAHAHKGPAEIEPKRAWTFRQVHWLAHRAGIPIATPVRHTFNSLALSRL